MTYYPSSPSPVFISLGRDPALNFALEEFLFASAIPEGGILLLYENNPAVIVGRSQNPWRECRTGLAERMGIPLFRRLSGGGTVVHGPGNVNYSIITAHPPNPKENLERIIRTLSGLGIEALTSGRHDLTVRTDIIRKVGGSAFRRTSQASMHHGTLLVNADLNGIGRLIRQERRDMDARGVPSKPSPMANLSDIHPGLTAEEIIRILAAEWGGGSKPQFIDPLNFTGDSVFDQTLLRLKSREWNFGKTPAFTERFSGLCGSGGCREDILEFGIKKGMIDEAPREAGFLKGVDYHGDDVLHAAGENPPKWIENLAARIDGDPV